MTEAAAGKVQPNSLRVTLWILLIVYIFNFLDRQIVNILAEPISRDLGLSDTQIGLMTGIAFAAFYTFLGIPIARYSDRPSTNRVNLISISLVIWSGMTALSGMAQNFIQLLLARIGVGVGEAG
ncbi:MAG: MFS transporter, partial [Novosphingobium sp.]